MHIFHIPIGDLPYFLCELPTEKVVNTASFIVLFDEFQH